VFLDRDGVLNKTIIKNNLPYPPACLEELVIIDDAYEALAQLKAVGFLLIGATNQPDVARGTTTFATVEAINNKLVSELPLNEIRACCHDDIDHCACRKPLPGLLLQAANDYGIDLDNSFMIGDRWRDIEAGHQAGCRTILIDYQYGERLPSVAPNYIANSLLQAAQWILNNINREKLANGTLFIT
jgi:D-glycero-D-manno-heptose 1,7-bisphosphate phosphatase